MQGLRHEHGADEATRPSATRVTHCARVAPRPDADRALREKANHPFSRNAARTRRINA